MEVNVKQRRCWKSRTTPLAISCLLRAIVPPPMQTPLDSPDSRPGGTSSPSPFSILNRVLSSLEPPHLEIIIVRVEWLLFYLKRDRFSQRKLVFSWQTMKLFDYQLERWRVFEDRIPCEKPRIYIPSPRPWITIYDLPMIVREVIIITSARHSRSET